jgi:hypothetical protein
LRRYRPRKGKFAVKHKGNAEADGAIATGEALVGTATAAIGVAETEEGAAIAAIGVAETKESAAISIYSGENAASAAEEMENASQFVEICPQPTAFAWQRVVIAWQSTLIAADFSAGAVAMVAKGAGIFSDWGATVAIATAKAAIAAANTVLWVGENPQFTAIWHIGPDGCSIPGYD